MPLRSRYQNNGLFIRYKKVGLATPSSFPKHGRLLYEWGDEQQKTVSCVWRWSNRRPYLTPPGHAERQRSRHFFSFTTVCVCSKLPRYIGRFLVRKVENKKKQKRTSRLSLLNEKVQQARHAHLTRYPINPILCIWIDLSMYNSNL